ncbi:MAG: hypothetical protein ACQES0_09345 [Bacteroidota bacterium]
MKKIAYLLIVVFAISMNSCSLFKGGDDTFEGYIKYKIEYKGDLDENTRAQLPTSVIKYYKDSKVREENETAMYSVYQITNSAKEEVIILMDMDMMGEKIAYKKSKEDMEEEMGEEMEDPEIRETGETKEILGYDTKKVELLMGDNIFTAYTTDELKTAANLNWAGQFRGVDGIILEYTTEQQGIITTYKATEIEKEKVPAEKFSIPSEYELKTEEEIKTMFGG